MIADIGSTTTDIALLRNGAPMLKPNGALVAGWQTMVEAADYRTCGLGGDSEVRPLSRGSAGGVTLGPRRAVPLSLLATQWPEAKPSLPNSLQSRCRWSLTDLCHAADAGRGAELADRSEARLAEKAIAMGPSSVADIAGRSWRLARLTG